MNRIAELKPASYQDIIDAPDGMIAEIVNGALHLQPQPATPHQRAGTALSSKLFTAFDLGEAGPGGWTILAEPEVHFANGDVFVPDLAGWRQETMPVFEIAPHIKTTPDWVCEILSPSTRSYDLTDKRPAYASFGVAHLWIVDPEARTLEAFALRDGEWVLIGALRDDAEVRLAPFDAVPFPLSNLWPPQPATDA